MNSDSSPEFMPEGESRYRLNVRVINSENGQDQSAETMKGNTVVAYSLGAGSYRVIGSKEDKKTKKIYYFVFGTSSDHKILEYDQLTSTVTLVLGLAALNFSITHLITGINVVEIDSTKHLLYWTDFYNVPRKINIEKAKYFSAGNFTLGYKSPFDVSILPRIKTPPIFAPTYIWGTWDAFFPTLPKQAINHLFQRLFQFKVQFVYDDYEVSAWSPISVFVMPQTQLSEVGYSPTGESYITQDDTIKLTVTTGSSIVTKIRIAGKDLSSTDFSLVAELDKSILQIGDDASYDFYFTNDGNYVSLEINESDKLFDNVPQLSQSQEIIADNRICDGLIQEGFDPVDIDMRLPMDFQDTADLYVANKFFPKRSYLKSGGAYKHGIVYYNAYNQSGTANITKGKSVEINVDGKFGTTLFVPFLTDPEYDCPVGLNSTQYVPTVSWEIYNAPPSWATHYQIVRSKNEAMSRYVQFTINEFKYVDIDDTVAVSPASALFLKIRIDNIWSRYKDENPSSKLVYDFVKGDRIRFVANADWAVYPPPLVPTAINNVAPFLGFNDAEIVSFDASDGTVKLAMSDQLPNTFPDAVKYGAFYEIYTPAASVINDNEIVYEIGENYELATDVHGNLVHQGSAENQLIVSFTSSTNPAADTYVLTTAVGHGLVATDKVKITTSGYNIYGVVSSVTATTLTIDTTGFSIVGAYNVALPGTAVKAAEGVFTSGDCFRRLADMPFYVFGPTVFRLYTYIECMQASNMFKSDAWDYGRPNKIDPNFRQIIRPSTVYYSEKLIPETTINGLSSVFDFNFQTYSADYGGIYKLFAQDQDLIAYQERKIMAIGVLQSVYSDPSTGARVVGVSTEVLNQQPRYYQGEFGIGKNPESWAQYGPAKYNIDINRGVVIRLSNDGITVISDTANMHNYFTDKCKSVLDYTGSAVGIYGVYDIKFSEYVISFNGGQGFVNETLAFNEDANVWSTFYSYIPENMCGNGVNIVSFKLGAIYLQNTNSVYNRFYNVDYTSKLWNYCNVAPSNQKVFKAISLESNEGWASTIETPSGQTTSLLDTNFKQKENFMYSEILMDDNTPNIVPFPVTLPDARFEGNPMRGQYALVKLEYMNPTYNKIFSLNIGWVTSNRSNI